MTNRERFCRVFDFKPVDGSPRWETPAFWGQTTQEWREEGGLPADADPMDYYGIERLTSLPTNAAFTQVLFTTPFEPELLGRDGPVEMRRDAHGRTLKTFTDGRSMPQWIRFPVESPADWEGDVRGRIVPEQHDFGNLEQDAKRFRDNPEVNGLFLCGLYAFWRNLWGEENLAYAFYDYPDTLCDQAGVWLRCASLIADNVLPVCRCDYVLLHEDMAFKTGPLIGPGLFRRFMLPYYKRLIAHLRSHGQTRFIVDSDGNNLAILPLFIEAGVGGLYSFEVAAGNDIRQVRRDYPEFVIWGGLDKRPLLKGKEAIRREVLPKVPEMWATGGYIPALDHSTPPCPQENWEYFLELIREQFPAD